MKALLPIAAMALVAAAPAPQNVRLQLDAMPVSEVVTILYRDVLRTPYVLTPEVSADRRPVSINLNASLPQARAQILAYLRAMGLSVENVAGVDQVSVATRSAPGLPGGYTGGGSYGGGMVAVGGSGAQGTPIAAAAVQPPVEEDVGLYAPRFRDPAYMADLLHSVFPTLRLSSRAVVKADGDTIQPQAAPDVLVFAGPKADVAKARQLIGQLDTEQAELTIKATVYEVQTGRSNSSALQIALNLLGGKIGLNTLSTLSPLDSFVRLATRNVDAVVSVLNNDSRFRVVTSPSVRTRSGAEAVLTAGSQVPVLGAVSYQGNNGVPVQSVEYRDSGTILRVTPSVHREVIDLDVSQELSNFVRTTSGVNNTPTLNKRALTNRLSVRAGDVIVLGGLTEDRDTKTRSGLFKGFLGARSAETQRTEILLILQVDTLGRVAGRARSDSEDGPAKRPASSPSL